MAEFDGEAVARALAHASEETKAEVARLLLQSAEDFERDYRREAVRKRGGVTRRNTASRSALQSRHSRGALSLADSIRRVVNQPHLQVFQNPAPHMHLIEFGTAPRYDATRGNAYRGFITGHEVWVPMAMRNRARFLVAAEALLARPQEL